MAGWCFLRASFSSHVRSPLPQAGRQRVSGSGAAVIGSLTSRVDVVLAQLLDDLVSVVREGRSGPGGPPAHAAGDSGVPAVTSAPWTRPGAGPWRPWARRVRGEDDGRGGQCPPRRLEATIGGLRQEPTRRRAWGPAAWASRGRGFTTSSRASLQDLPGGSRVTDLADDVVGDDDDGDA